MKLKKILISSILLLSLTSLSAEEPITLSREELMRSGEKIFVNETGGKKENLIHWNIGEEFASLGVGHFIWYPEGFDGPFDESFPSLKEYYISRGVDLPQIFAENDYCPWDSIEEFNSAKSGRDVQEAIDFLDATKDIQVSFIYLRLQGALEEMLKVTDKKDHVKEQFYRVASAPGGLYPLIDYVNFKGEGIKETERYNGYGWGLLQIFEEMQGTSSEDALAEFREKARFVLQRRVDNAPEERGEERWIPGWNKRIDTYRD